MRKIIIHALIWIFCIPALLAGVPKIGDLKPNEQITISLVYSEPGINEYKYVFSNRSVTISENGKTLGKLAITADEAERIDRHLWSVQRARKASRNLLGAPVYTIQHEISGKTIGMWSYRIRTPKDSGKPVLSLDELRKRFP